MIQKNCYLSSDPVAELQQLYEMYCANENIRDNKKMKYFLQGNFKESICFTLARGMHGNPIVVHAHEVNPVDYAIASIIGARLLHEEITIPFEKIIHRKKNVKKQERVFHYLLKICLRNSINITQSKKYVMPCHSQTIL